ncbi:MAG: ATP-binding cassette domain-containing protein, partial [Phycisphaerales bacterium]
GGAGHRPVGEYSKGMTRRLGIAQALINDPEFLILDEPTSGLDPIGTKQVKDLLVDLKKRGKTILLSSHLLADVEDVCDRMVILYGGRVRASGTGEDLLRDSSHTLIRTGRLHDGTIAEIERVLASREGFGIDGVELPRQKLEEFFLQIVERARAEQVATSGAASGGPTAKFLMGEEASEGDSLIEGLVRGETAAAPAVAKSVVAAAPQAPEKEAVLEELLQPQKPAATAPTPKAPAAPKGVDSAVIDGLLGGEPESGATGKDGHGA